MPEQLKELENSLKEFIAGEPQQTNQNNLSDLAKGSFRAGRMDGIRYYWIKDTNEHYSLAISEGRYITKDSMGYIHLMDFGRKELCMNILESSMTNSRMCRLFMFLNNLGRDFTFICLLAGKRIAPSCPEFNF